MQRSSANHVLDVCDNVPIQTEESRVPRGFPIIETHRLPLHQQPGERWLQALAELSKWLFPTLVAYES